MEKYWENKSFSLVSICQSHIRFQSQVDFQSFLCFINESNSVICFDLIFMQNFTWIQISAKSKFLNFTTKQNSSVPGLFNIDFSVDFIESSKWSCQLFVSYWSRIINNTILYLDSRDFLRWREIAKLFSWLFECKPNSSKQISFTMKYNIFSFWYLVFLHWFLLIMMEEELGNACEYIPG